MKLIVNNKKLHFNYIVNDVYECGISLKGTEVKSIVAANLSIDEAFVIFKNHEAFVINMYVAPFEKGNINNVDSYRTRKLLLHKNEILKIDFQAKKDRLAVIPNKIYLKHGHIKLEIALCKSKNTHDKRETKKKLDMSRELKKFKK
jgi:SsrA-binding protein